jgi:hypothetical integral membrane protein (TIGR02206 family)
MSQFFAKDWTGAPFVLFGPPHVIALVIVALVNLSVVLLRHSSPRARRVFRYTLATVLVADEMAWHLWNYFTGQWTIQTMLPLHVCSIMVWLSAYMLITENYRLYEFVYFMGIGAATQALLTPDAGRYGFPHFRAFQTMISHGSIVMAAIYMTVVEGFRPHGKSFLRLIVWLNVYMAVVFVINLLIGSNYLYIARKPETASLMDVLGPWPWYILSLEAIGLAICFLLYLPFAIKDWRAKAMATKTL